jgi:hypothetical protein
MQIFLTLVNLVFLIYLWKCEKEFRKTVTFQLQELHIRLSAKQDRKPTTKLEEEYARLSKRYPRGNFRPDVLQSEPEGGDYACDVREGKED